VLILAAMVVVIFVIGRNFRSIGAAIGFRMARERRMRKRSYRYNIFVLIIFCAAALGAVILKEGSILNPRPLANYTITSIVGKNATPPTPLQTDGFLPALSNLVQNTWVTMAFLGLLVVGGLVVIESIRVSLKETADVTILELQGNQEQGLQAVHEAIKLVDDAELDPRSRIIESYQHLVGTVSRLGAPVSSDMTARELDKAVRSTFALKGPAITELTQLFEEARYSLHEIRDSDADKAHTYLKSIADELRVQLQIET
jgi:hypothetical protein